MSFKIIGIEILSECNRKHYKNLLTNNIYTFYSNYEFKDDGIFYYKQGSDDLYIIDNLNVNISAIVGKNGSGKSTIIEILIKIINNFFYKYREQKSDLGLHDVILVSGVEASLYFQIEDRKLFKLLFKNNNYEFYEYDWDYNEFSISADYSINNLFYSEIINYSFYAYNDGLFENENSEESWISNVFHKNDSYQTPVVLNPYRYNGVINVNKEDRLIYQRLLYNLLLPNGNKKLGDNLVASKIFIKSLKPRKKFIEYEFIDDTSEKKEVKYTITDDLSLRIAQKYLESNNLLKGQVKDKIFEETKFYLGYKIISICIKYNEFKDYFDFGSNQFKEKDIDQCLININGDNSHITFKLKQIDNYLNYTHEYYILGESFEINNVSKKVSNIASSKNKNIFQFILPSIFLVDVYADSITGNEKDINFTTLSSGEKQLIHSLNSVYYHLINLYSVRKSTDKKIVYNNINIIFEEIEMYFHPDYQRKFIGLLIEGIRSLNLKNINLNIILVTHSPFILSDIPNENIMFLEIVNGRSKQIKEHKNTLGANIYDILADSFFFNNDCIFMGEFIKNKINEVITYINEGIQDSNHEKYKNFIKILDEPILQKKLEQMFNDKFKEDSVLSKQKELQAIKKRLEDLGYDLIKKA